ncbi:hypothetical protein HAX54_037661 [Datura stramonium]|uniref:t-SNARE coiled-coil homology domain-containing protein n=1 Tax=Datura stramonium TaxID=4076 RepID=A0ABS8VLM2_DATST|nr:hypothetical protein [Datura stramonium]
MTHLTKEIHELEQEIDMFGLGIHDLEDDLSAKVDVFNAQQFSVELCEAGKLVALLLWVINLPPVLVTSLQLKEEFSGGLNRLIVLSIVFLVNRLITDSR